MRIFLAVVYRIAVNIIGIGLAALLFRHAQIANGGALILAGVVLSAINLILKPVIAFLAIPVLVFTLGLFYLIICGAVILLTSWVVPGFHVDGIWTAIGVSIVVGAVNFFFDLFAGNRGDVYVIRR